MHPLILRASARHLRRHPWQLGLGLLGIALGVAVVCAVQLTQQSARQALAFAKRTVLGDATDRIARAGDDLDEAVYRSLVLALPAIRFSPIVRADLTLPAAPGRVLTLAGVDPLAHLDRRQAARRLGPAVDVARLMAEPDAAVMNVPTAARLALAPGSRFTVDAGGRRATLTLIALAPPPATAGGLADDLVVVDIATAQELLGRPGRLSAIEVLAPAAAERAALRERLPAGVDLVATAADLAATRALTRAFDTNLTALSLLALLVGMFLVYNAQTFLVLQRLPVFSRLRALGVTRREIFAALALEALVLGMIGSALGAAAGIGLAELLIGRVATTINDLYYRAAITDVAIAPRILAAAVAAGVAATLAAVLAPAGQAARVPVVNSLSRLRGEIGAVPHGHRAPLIAALGLGAAALLAGLPTQRLDLGFGAVFAFLLGGAALVPPLLAWLAARVVDLPGASRWPERLGAGTVWRLDRRSGPAAAALTVAAAAGIGIGVMTASFRTAVADWLHTMLRADVYVSSTQGPAALAAARERLLALPGVAAISSVRRLAVESEFGSVALLGYELPPAARAGFQFVAGPAPRWWNAWEGASLVFVTRPFAYRHRLRPGDTLWLATPHGRVTFAVGGVYVDYANEHGAIAMSRATLLRHWPVSGYDGLGLYARAGVAAPALVDSVRAAVPVAIPLKVQANASVRETSLAVFDRTFAVTEILRVLAIAVAIAGVLSALLAQQLERARDYGLLRALGASGSEIARSVLTQTSIIGLCAASAAVPLGLGLAVMLIEIINQRSFGWRMDLDVPWLTVAMACALVVVAALIAGAYPAYRATRIPPAQALRDE